MHDVLNGKAVTGILHFYNKTPIDWYCKKQATSETATYSSEFMACRTCLEQVIDHRNYLQYLGIPVFRYSYVWGYNESQVKSSIIPHSKLRKQHQILSYHFVRSILLQRFANLHHVRSQYNASDPLTKHWGYNDVYNIILGPLLLHAGNTNTLMNDDTLTVDRSIPQEDLLKIISDLHDNGEY